MQKGIVVSPHASASSAGAEILQAGGNCVEAALAVASALCVVYPHMTGLGGDGFWLIAPSKEAFPKEDATERTSSQGPLFIDASGPAGKGCDLEAVRANGYSKIPTRGPWSALTMAGAVGGWIEALNISRAWSLPGHAEQSLGSLFQRAVSFAHEGFAITPLLHDMLQRNARILSTDRAFKATYYPQGSAPERGSFMRLPALGKVFERLAKDGLESFYKGALADEMAQDLARLGSPLLAEDFDYSATVGEALTLETSWGTFYNSPPPTQGVSSLMILGQLLALHDKGVLDFQDEGAAIHVMVEATKNAFTLRNRHVADPRFMETNCGDWLKEDYLSALASRISFERASPWPVKSQPGDTVWFGVIDRWGNAVSCIQSIYHEFGSGMMLPSSGIVWHNRALGFSLDPEHINCLEPGKKPFHTLNPAMARLADGRLLSYGTMGGEGQPQTQAALMFRYLGQNLSPAEAVKAPRWLLGRTWGEASDNLKLEENLDNRALSFLHGRGHSIELVDAQSPLMGHAGILVRHGDGHLEGGHDPRSDGAVEAI